MDNGVTAWLDWDTERVAVRGRTARVTVRGELADLDRRAAEWVLADTLDVDQQQVVVTLDELAVVLPAGRLAEPATYRALIDEAVAHSWWVSGHARRGDGPELEP